MKKCISCSKYYDEKTNRSCPYCKDKPSFIDGEKRGTVQYSRPTVREESDNRTIIVSNTSKENSFNKAPVVGWFIVTKGEGVGSDIRIVAGMNSIGRGDHNKINLDYGDNTISKDHATVIYDYKNNIFFFQHGVGANLSYINNSVILQPIELKSGDIIGLGETELMFIPLCNEKFKWDSKTPSLSSN